MIRASYLCGVADRVPGRMRLAWRLRTAQSQSVKCDVSSRSFANRPRLRFCPIVSMAFPDVSYFADSDGVLLQKRGRSNGIQAKVMPRQGSKALHRIGRGTVKVTSVISTSTRGQMGPCRDAEVLRPPFSPITATRPPLCTMRHLSPCRSSRGRSSASSEGS